MWNWVAMSPKAGWAEAACSSASFSAAAPGSASENMPGTRSAKTLTPCALPARRPAPSSRLTTPAKVNQLEGALKQSKTKFELYRYEAQHAFMNEARPQVYDAGSAKLAWERTMNFLGEVMK